MKSDFKRGKKRIIRLHSLVKEGFVEAGNISCSNNAKTFVIVSIRNVSLQKL